MLYSFLRLGSLKDDLIHRPSFKKTAFALAAMAALAAPSILGAFPAAAQQVTPVSNSQASPVCEKAVAIGNAITDKYKVSAAMARSFVKFAKSNCDDVDWEIATPVDKKAFEEFRVRLIVLKQTAQAAPIQ